MANGSAGSIYVDLLLRDANFVQGLSRSQRASRQASSGISKEFRSMSASIAAVTVATAGAVAGINAIISNTISYQNEQAQLTAVLKSTGNAAGFTAKQLNAMSDSLSENSIFSGGQITNAQTRLLSYVGIVGENIPRAMQAVIDQSARLNISLEQSAETIGRALEQPSKAAAALSRQGFGSYFTKEVVDMLKTLEQQGKVAEAQVKILEVLEESYAGAGRAARDTLGGAITNLQNTISSILTAEGGLPGLTKAVNDFAEMLRMAAKDSNLFETFLYGAVSAMYDFIQAYNELSVVVARKTNFFGIRDEDVAAYEANVAKVIAARERLGLDLLARKELEERVGFSSPSLPTNTPPIIDHTTEADIKRVNSAYEKYEHLIRGVSKEVIALEEAERELNELRLSGRISQDEMTLALERYKEEASNAKKEMDDFAKNMAENVQDAFADFLFDPFQDGLDGMLKGFVDTIRKMIAQAQAANIARALFGESAGGSGEGVFGGLLKNLGGIFAGSFAEGGFIPPGQFGIVGEGGGWQHAEMVMGGRSGATVIPQGKMGGGGNTYYVDAKGADMGAVRRIEQGLLALAGPGVIEQRVINAQARGAI